MLLVHFLMVLGSGMAMRPENSQGAEVMHSAVVQGTPHRIVASLLNQTTRADPRLALVGQSLAQMLDGNPNPEGEFNSLTDSLRDVLNKLLDEAKAAAGLAQANAQKEADSFEDCHSMDPHFQNFDDELQEHVQCRQAASALKTTADACNSEKAALKGTMEIACQAYDDYKAADHSCPARYSGESIEEWLLKAKNQFATRYDDYLDKKKACDDATADHDVVDCTSKNSAYEAKEGECDALYITLETHSCDHATVASQLADQYETCYEDKKNEYLEREAEMELETQRKLNSRLSMRILCLLDSVQEDADSKAFTIKEDAFEVCADKPEYDTDHLEVDWPPLPDESPPVVPSAYPCNTAYDEKVRAKLPTFADVPVCTECPGVIKDGPGKNAAVGTCYNSRPARPLGWAGSVQSVGDCIALAKGYKYFAFGCPQSSGFECWKGNSIDGRSREISMDECAGTLLTNIGNSQKNSHCHGFPAGTYTQEYEGLTYALGGWHREPVYEVPAQKAAVGTCYNSRPARPLGWAGSVQSVGDCIALAKGYKYFAFGCPQSSGFECWKGNSIDGRSREISMDECAGTLLTNIGNSQKNSHCHGFPAGTYTQEYEGVTYALGGWHREPVYETP